MEQKITIVVLRSTRSIQVAEIQSNMDLNTLADRMREEGDLIHFVSYIDFWSMGDSFAKYLPAEVEQENQFGSIWVVNRDRIQFDSSPGTFEEKMFLNQLQIAKKAYPDVDSNSTMIVVREVLGASIGLRTTNKAP